MNLGFVEMDLAIRRGVTIWAFLYLSSKRIAVKLEPSGLLGPSKKTSV